MAWPYNPGRVAGCFYLLTGFSIVGPMYVGSAIVARDNAAAALHHITAHELLFRFGIVCDWIAGLGCLLAALALYKLFQGVNRQLAVLMVMLGGLMPCVIGFLNGLNDVAALVLACGEPFVSLFDKAQQTALAALFRRLRDHGFLIDAVSPDYGCFRSGFW